jgi:hypothetical protein
MNVYMWLYRNFLGKKGEGKGEGVVVYRVLSWPLNLQKKRESFFNKHRKKRSLLFDDLTHNLKTNKRKKKRKKQIWKGKITIKGRTSGKREECC